MLFFTELARGGWVMAPLLVGSIVVWLAAIAVVSRRRLGRSWRRVSTGRRRPRGDPDGPTGDSTTAVPVAEGDPGDAGTTT